MQQKDRNRKKVRGKILKTMRTSEGDQPSPFARDRQFSQDEGLPVLKLRNFQANQDEKELVILVTVKLILF